jgi:hypothetical protein
LLRGGGGGMLLLVLVSAGVMRARDNHHAHAQRSTVGHEPACVLEMGEMGEMRAERGMR